MKSNTPAALQRLIEAAADQPLSEQFMHVHQLVGQLTGNIIIIGDVPAQTLELILKTKPPPGED